MKKLILSAAALLAFGFAQAQKIDESKLPAIVKAGFATKYKGVKTLRWEKEGADYEAVFNINDHEASAVFTAAGMFKEEEQQIHSAEMPQPAQDYCRINYMEYTQDRVEMVTKADGNVLYEVLVSKSPAHAELTFDKAGSFLKKEDVKGSK